MTPASRNVCAGLLGAAGLAVSTPAPAPLCVDAKGHKVYQQSPCPDLNVRSGIEPVAAEALTQQNVVETLKRFDAALAKRDVPAVAAFLDDDFTAVAYAVDSKDKNAPPRRLDAYTRKTFINSFGRTANAVSAYNARRSNCQVTLEESEALAVCDNQESVVVTSHTARTQSKEHARVVIRKGRVLLRALDQYTTRSDLSTQSVAPTKR